MPSNIEKPSKKSQKTSKLFPFARSIGSLFGIGFIPLMPGTIASLTVIILVYFLFSIVSTSVGMDIEIGLVLLLIGLLSGVSVVRNQQDKDPSWFVWDEVAGMWLALTGLPKDNIVVVLVAFAAFRLFDIWKPWIIDRSQKIGGAVGIMVDDVLAAVPAWIIAFIVWKIIT